MANAVACAIAVPWLLKMLPMRETKAHQGGINLVSPLNSTAMVRQSSSCTALNVVSLSRVAMIDQRPKEEHARSLDSKWVQGHYPHQECVAESASGRSPGPVTVLMVSDHSYAWRIPGWASEVRSLLAACAIGSVSISNSSHIRAAASTAGCKYFELPPQVAANARKHASESNYDWAPNSARALAVRWRFAYARALLTQGQSVLMHDADVHFKPGGLAAFFRFSASSDLSAYDFLVQDNGARREAYDDLNWGFVWMNANSTRAAHLLGCVLDTWTHEAFQSPQGSPYYRYHARSQPRINHVLEAAITAARSRATAPRVCKLSPVFQAQLTHHMTGYPSLQHKLACAKAFGIDTGDSLHRTWHGRLGYRVPHAASVAEQATALAAAVSLGERQGYVVAVPSAVAPSGEATPFCQLFDATQLPVSRLAASIPEQMLQQHCDPAQEFSGMLQLHGEAGATSTGTFFKCLHFTSLLRLRNESSVQRHLLRMRTCNPTSAAVARTHACHTPEWSPCKPNQATACHPHENQARLADRLLTMVLSLVLVPCAIYVVAAGMPTIVSSAIITMAATATGQRSRDAAACPVASRTRRGRLVLVGLLAAGTAFAVLSWLRQTSHTSSEVHLEDEVPLTAKPTNDVGLLYVVFSGTKASDRARGFVAEATASCVLSKRVQPLLPIALATNLQRDLSADAKRCFDVLQPIAVDCKDNATPWAPRLRALQHSPFRLTLALDAHSVACVPQLLTMLQLELTRNAFDFAVGSESMLGKPLQADYKANSTSLWPTTFPDSAASVLPHNWALLLRRGPGTDALIALWRRELRRMDWPDDQAALYNVLRRTYHRRCATTNSTPFAADSPRCVRVRSCRRQMLMLKSCHWREQPLRISRLREGFAAMKSVDKQRFGFFPRYTRTLESRELAVAVHQMRPYPWNAALEPHSDFCAALNSEPTLPRLVLQTHERSPHRVFTNRQACYLQAASLRSQLALHRAVRRVCDLLPARFVAAGSSMWNHSGHLVEPIGQFWSGMRLRRTYGPDFP